MTYNSRVEGETEASLDSWSDGLGVAEAKDTRVVDLGLDEGSVVLIVISAHIHLCEKNSYHSQGRSWHRPRARHR